MNYDNLKIALLLFVLQIASIQAQVKYIDASELKLIGKISDQTETLYERLPKYIKDVSRTPVWNLGKNTSGLAIRFKSNSSSISVKWEVAINNHMNHMADTGVKGLDLYALVDNSWRFVNVARPTGKVNEVSIVSSMEPIEREYMLYLPLYDGVLDLQIGVDSISSIENTTLNSPITSAPIIVYGTSITQGGCATRPGMSYTNILSRLIDKEIINLGFSGNGQLDHEIAELMSTRTDAGLFILDFIPNVSMEQLKDKTIPFVENLRSNNPNIPLLFVESVLFTHIQFDTQSYEIVINKNEELKKQFDTLKSLGHKNIYYLSSDNLIGNDGEATVDGVHLTDIGFLRMAEVLRPVVKTIISNK